MRRRCFIALGSNVGNRCEHLSRAWQHIEKSVGKILATSSLYDTTPALVVDQARFLNAMVAVETSLEPLEVLDELKRIEKVLGRQTERLTVPHPRAHERDFVMVPMADVAARLGDASPEVKMMLSKGEALSARSSSCVEHMFCGPRNKKTMVMGVVNATPDSFSDGGQDAASVARRIVESGADVIDVGGESTRPGAEPVPPDQEIDRVVPLIETLCRDFPDLIVSIDTRRASVAEAATSVGASVVNDISGAADQDMLKVVANTSAAYVASHCRGNPQTMQTLTDYDDLIRDVSFELSDVVSRAKAAGIAPWRLIVDPGIGFAKNHQQNIALLRHLPDIKRNLDDLPLLVGPSRKGFIGTITNEPRADRRDWGTAGACCACVPTADILRVHNVPAMKQALAVVDSIYRIE